MKHAWLIPALLAAGVALYTRFTHPDLTETRLLLGFWPVWLAVLLLVLLAVAIAPKPKRHR